MGNLADHAPVLLSLRSDDRQIRSDHFAHSASNFRDLLSYSRLPYS